MSVAEATRLTKYNLRANQLCKHSMRSRLSQLKRCTIALSRTPTRHSNTIQMMVSLNPTEV